MHVYTSLEHHNLSKKCICIRNYLLNVRIYIYMYIFVHMLQFVEVDKKKCASLNSSGSFWLSLYPAYKWLHN